MAPSQFLTGLMGTTDKSHGHFWGFLEKQVEFLFLNADPTHNTQTGTQLLQEPGPISWGRLTCLHKTCSGLEVQHFEDSAKNLRNTSSPLFPFLFPTI